MSRGSSAGRAALGSEASGASLHQTAFAERDAAPETGGEAQTVGNHHQCSPALRVELQQQIRHFLGSIERDDPGAFEIPLPDFSGRIGRGLPVHLQMDPPDDRPPG